MNMSPNHFSPRITPAQIDSLAVWGNGERLQGCSYAIPTMEGWEKKEIDTRNRQNSIRISSFS